MDRLQETIYEHAFNHFSERLLERYGLTISKVEYGELLKSRFTGKFAKNQAISVGFIIYNNTKIWCLKNTDRNLFSTALPPSIEFSTHGMAAACFPKALRDIVFLVLENIEKELSNDNYNFNSDKEAAIYFFKNCNYANLVIDKYKFGVVDVFKIIYNIRYILNGKHPKLKIGLVSK